MKSVTTSKNHWQKSLIEAVTEPKELLQILNLDANLLPAAEKAAKLFPLKVPRSFVARMQKGNINDPLLRQVLPIHEEYQETVGYSRDPLEEAAASPVPGLLHKYHGRVLFIFTGACGINCRYCFRRYFDYEDNNPGKTGWENALRYIEQDSSINEVILSGGDPLVASDQTLKKMAESLSAIPSIKRFRIHSRMPIAMPERITPELIAAMTSTQFKTIMVVHSNHPHEINNEVKDAMQLLKQAGIVLLNQTVLLKGVNDDVEILISLSEALFDAGIQPYYLNVLDKVQSAAHFDLDSNIACELQWKMSKRLPGYLVPKLVCEQPGAPAKLSVPAREFYTD